MHSGSFKPARPVWGGLALKEKHAQDEGGCTLRALGSRSRLVAWKGDTCDRLTVVHGSGPVPSTSLPEICYSQST